VSRRVRSDFGGLKVFVEKYSVAAHAADDKFLALLSRLHKRYYAILVFLAELGAAQKRIRSKNTREKARVTGLYLREFISDLAGALFDWVHGAYKPSRLSLRSAIENLLKGLCFSTRPEIIKQKNVYEVFNSAAQTPLLAAGPGRQLFARLRYLYSILCVDAHGGNITNMPQISALGYFPRFDAVRAEQLAKIYSDLARDALCLLCLSRSSLLTKMHYENVDIVTSILPNAVKRSLHGID
jgi:hypothetical protein